MGEKHGWMVEIGPGKAATNWIKFAEFVVVVVVVAVSYNFRIVCGSYLHLNYIYNNSYITFTSMQLQSSTI